MRPPSPALVSALGLATLLVACGGTPSRARPGRSAASPAPVALGALEPGAVYAIDHDVEERLDGSLLRIRRTRVVLWVRERRPDGAFDATATLTRQDEGSEEIARAVVAIQLGPDGTLRRDPDVLCDHADDDLFAGRFIRHVVAPYPRGERAELFVEQREQPLRAALRRRGDTLRAEAPLALDQDAIAEVHATGATRVRVLAEVDPIDPLQFDVRTRIEGTPVVRAGDEPSRPRPVRIDERTRSVRAAIRRPPPSSCADIDGGDFDVRVVIRMIQTRQQAIRACYERELRTDRSLQGRVKVSLTILEDGHVANVRVVERTMPGPRGEAVAECVVRVVSGFRFNPGPDGGSVTYQFPFVFEPQP